MPIFHIDDSAVNGDRIIIPNNKLVHHLEDVLRVRLGESIKFFDSNACFETVVHSIDKSGIACTIKNKSNLDFPKVDIALANAFIDKEPMETILRLNIPYFVSEFSFFKAERSNLNINDKILLRLNSVALSIAEQSEACFVPSVKMYNNISDLISENRKRLIIALNPHSGRSIYTISEQLKDASDILLIVGPAGGFTDQELSIMKEYGALEAKFKSAIFRSEFAGFVAISMLREFLLVP